MTREAKYRSPVIDRRRLLALPGIITPILLIGDGIVGEMGGTIPASRTGWSGIRGEAGLIGIAESFVIS